MKIRFWGVRGSVPVPGPNTAKYGGNTSCVEIITDSGFSMIMDAGTGIREFGLDYVKRPGFPKDVHLFISHVHWDHIQGLPYFTPIYLADMNIHIHSGIPIEEDLRAQMKPPYFPVSMSDLKSKISYNLINGNPVEIAGCRVTPISLIHPQEVFGFVVSENGKSVVYSSDTEHEIGSHQNSYIEMIKDANVMLFDAQYTPEEYRNGRVGWGHSTYEAAVEIAKGANVEQLVLFHHEPTHDDEAVDSIERTAKALFPNTIAAREGMVIEV